MNEHDAESRRTQRYAKKVDGNLDNEADKAPALPFGFQPYLQVAREAEVRYQQNDDVRALDEAATAWEQILHHPNFSTLALQFRLPLLDEAGRFFRRRYQVTGIPADLDRAVELWQSVVALAPSGLVDRPMYLNDLGIGLQERYAHVGGLVDLEQAIAAWDQAVATTPGSPCQDSYLTICCVKDF